LSTCFKKILGWSLTNGSEAGFYTGTLVYTLISMFAVLACLSMAMYSNMLISVGFFSDIYHQYYHHSHAYQYAGLQAEQWFMEEDLHENPQRQSLSGCISWMRLK
jgi:hypothetical protein